MEPDKAQIKKVEARVEYLEKLAKRQLFSFELLQSMGELHHGASLERDSRRLITITREHLEKMVRFDAMGFLIVDESDSDFVLEVAEPENYRDFLQEELDEQINNGAFSWALTQNRPVLVKSQEKEKILVLHTLASKRRVRGMFVGLIGGKTKDLDDALQYQLSIILQNTAKALESVALYNLVYEQNHNLEEIVKSRTMELETQNVQLKEEIAYRKLAEESLVVAKNEAEAAAQAKSEFIANISHEIRTPLNAILGYSEILQFEAKKIDRPDFIEDLQTIDSAGRHLLTLINDILDFSKIQAGKMELHDEPVYLKNFLGEVVATVRPLAEKNRNLFELKCPEDIGEMRTDMMRLRQVLLNLLSNACKFTKNGSIILEVERSKIGQLDMINFSVTDTGIGIDSDQIDDLFREFEQGDSSKTRKYGGTGLGLAISQRLSQMMGGEITVKSELNKGSVFGISLPADAGQMDEVAGTEKFTQPTQGQEKSGGKAPDKENALDSIISGNQTLEKEKRVGPRDTVLVIDNDKVVSDLILRFLNKEGFHVEIANDGEEGIRLAKNILPSVILFDSNMTGVDGWMILSALKNESKLDQTPIIVMADEENRKKAMSFGVSGFLTKPLNWDHLVNSLKKFRKKISGSPILLVEDDVTNREMLSRILNKEGWKVNVAVSGVSALEYVKKKLPALIILDISLPDQNGFEFVKKLRKNQDYGNIPILVITARELNRAERTQLEGDVQNILQKGNYTRSELMDEIRYHVVK